MDNNHFESLGETIKRYERGSDTLLTPRVPIVARLDGRAFHTFTKGLQRPYDKRLMELMDRTAEALVDEFIPDFAYTQSDEITLAWVTRGPGFDNRVQKLASLLASCASVAFNTHLKELIPEKAGQRPTFDCRVFSVPNREAVFETLIWRQEDAIRNSVAMLAQAYFSPAQLHQKNRKEQMNMLYDKGIQWAAEPPRFKQGVIIRRATIHRELTEEELQRIPESHRAPMVGTTVCRSTIVRLNALRGLSGLKEIDDRRLASLLGGQGLNRDDKVRGLLVDEVLFSRMEVGTQEYETLMAAVNEPPPSPLAHVNQHG